MNSAGQGLPGDPYGYRPDTFECPYPTVAKKETVALKPCPFCGSDAREQNTITGMWNIICNGCGAMVSDWSEESVIRRWNRRADECKYYAMTKKSTENIANLMEKRWGDL